MNTIASDSASPAAAHWLVVGTHAHREHIAVENLQRQDFNTYCPMIRRRIKHARKVQDVLRPLFPGYVFVEIDQQQPRWRPILSTMGVRGLVKFGDSVGRLDPSFIAGLKAQEVDGAITRPGPSFEVGQQIRMAGGPFDGLIARIVDLDEKDRLIVLMDLLNQSVRVTVTASGVTALDAD